VLHRSSPELDNVVISNLGGPREAHPYRRRPQWRVTRAQLFRGCPSPEKVIEELVKAGSSTAALSWRLSPASRRWRMRWRVVRMA